MCIHMEPHSFLWFAIVSYCFLLSPMASYGFLYVSCSLALGFLWVSHDFTIHPLWISYVSLWHSYSFPMELLLVFTWDSYALQCFLLLSYGFLGFPMGIL